MARDDYSDPLTQQQAKTLMRTLLDHRLEHQPLKSAGYSGTCWSFEAMTSLSANLNKVALLRNTRTIGIPNVVHAARIALGAGAHGIRSIRVPTGATCAPTMCAISPRRSWQAWRRVQHRRQSLPWTARVRARSAAAQCTLVPDETGAFTSDRGWTSTATPRGSRRWWRSSSAWACA